MRITLILSALFALTGCGQVENGLTPLDRNSVEHTEGDEDNFDVDELETDETTEPDPSNEEDEQPYSPGDCNGFIISEGFGHYKETQSYASFSLIGDREVEVSVGEEVTLLFAVTAHVCGDIVVTGMTIIQSVIDDQPADWVTEVEHDGINSTMTNPSGGAEFQAIDGYNVTTDWHDRNIFYEWDVDVWNSNVQGQMEEIVVETNTTELIEFTFTVPDSIESGTIFNLRLLDPEWIDVGTGAHVWDTSYYLPDMEENIVGIEVTVVE